MVKHELRAACSDISTILSQGIGDGSWRGRKELYRHTDPLSLQGVMDISVCWFAQGHEVRAPIHFCDHSIANLAFPVRHRSYLSKSPAW